VIGFLDMLGDTDSEAAFKSKVKDIISSNPR
jgi:hypothetical protein